VPIVTKEWTGPQEISFIPIGPDGAGKSHPVFMMVKGGSRQILHLVVLEEGYIKAIMSIFMLHPYRRIIGSFLANAREKLGPILDGN
jgi:hypothetical protein